MTKRITVSISLQPEDLGLLKAVAVELDLSASELIRRMLHKIAYDEKNKAIIKGENYSTLYNAHYAMESKKAEIIEVLEGLPFEKNNPGHDSREDSSSLDPTNNIPHCYQREQMIKRDAKKYTVDQIARFGTQAATKAAQHRGTKEQKNWEEVVFYWQRVLKEKKSQND